MNNYYGNNSWDDFAANSNVIAPSDSVVSAFMRRVYAIMACGLTITGVTAWGLRDYFMNNIEVVQNLGGLFWLIVFAPMLFVMVLNFGIHRLSYAAASALFGVYAVFEGAWLSLILLKYSTASIATTFFITAGMFAVMSVVGFITKINLSRMGSLLMMAMIGIVIAGLVNIFLQSSGLYWIISIIGVIVFTALTAYDTQRLKEMSAIETQNPEFAQKASIIGALSLYLNFIVLFVYLLRFFGSSNDD